MGVIKATFSPARPSDLARSRCCQTCLPKSLAAMLVLAAFADPALAARAHPNILFIVMDDVGIDQMKLFGYGGPQPPSTPTIDQIAGSGIRFRNTWAMPACSTSRSVFYDGRFPLRTDVYGALGPDDLANSQVSPYELTIPKLLKQKGYKSALFGKFHIGLQSHNPFGLSMVSSVGWDTFEGWLDYTGDPSSIDGTAGGVAAEGTWSCGFVPGAEAPGGSDLGACYAADGSCQVLRREGAVPPGRICRDKGGIFDPARDAQRDPGKICQPKVPDYIQFSTLNGHYVSPLARTHESGLVEFLPRTDIRARTFRGTVPVNAAIDWINRQPKDQPWMATVAFASAHTPVMQPPPDLLPPGAADTNRLDCGNPVDQRILTNQMIEALDSELGRLLVAIGIADRGPNGRLRYRPRSTDTMVVILGDNGSFGNTVKPPFDPSRAKGTAYQTGVWVPLVIAGPRVNRPNREVRHMVNIADLYQLFGELAGINVKRAVPRTIDSVPMLPYLVNPRQGSIRKWNFTQVGPNEQANHTLNGPCTIGGTCTQIPVTPGVCQDNGGIWWGNHSTQPNVPPGGYQYCCQVNMWVTQNQPPNSTYYTIQPLSAVAVRNKRYKLVRNFSLKNDPAYTSCVPMKTDEFYEINEAARTPRLKLDRAEAEIPPEGRTAVQKANFKSLNRRLDKVLSSQPPCPGDGNIDGVVNSKDLADWRFFADLAKGQSSWYDFNQDGLTNGEDEAIILANLGTRCPRGR